MTTKAQFEICVHRLNVLHPETTEITMNWESFYEKHPSPSNYESTIAIIEHFVSSHKNEKIALVTVSVLTLNNNYYL